MKWYVLLQVWLVTTLAAAQQQRKNVLMVIVDDLRPEIGRYIGTDNSLFPGISTPNIDAFANTGVTFTQAHSQITVCGPSRVTMLTSRRPESTHQFHNRDGHWRDLGGNFTSLPQHFKQSGYHSVGMGKTFHGYDSDYPYSWSEPYYEPPNMDEWKLNVSWLSVDESSLTEPLPDTYIKDYAVQKLRELAPKALSGEQLFCMAVGFNKPHLPFTAPSTYFDLYPADDIYLPANPYASHKQPEISWIVCPEQHSYDDMNQYELNFNTTFPDYYTLELRRAYYACTSYIDALFGEVMQTLQDVGLRNNTVVLFVSDHGWKLGEHSAWCKETNYELDTKLPMILRVPSTTAPGTHSNSIVELADVFPTIVESAGLDPIALCPRNATSVPILCMEGLNVLNAVNSPDNWKNVAFSQFERQYEEDGIYAMGYSARTHEYRFTQWVAYDFTEYEPDWSTVYGEELYDHVTDPDENNNVYELAEYEVARDEMYAVLRRGWRGAINDAA